MAANKGNITNQIRRLRFDHNEMTQAELAKAAGVTRQTIMSLEANKYSPSLELAFRIAGVFNQPLEAVFQFQPAGAEE
ncbi:helix-turn-helix transcriptional regulator [Bowmanella sp. Y26]|uniref:helix-turn-helix transcriptional regulator n=1 Tax=Bowmanella yangjiangensis TaxID=2811230 RepID=UPI001BDD1AAD|nr:helix-turn-helix transcriptional regulator [Bowmanella yangjiangensis]MBT1064653.1 helix-turn-helix transcriptional regulator [Bowmanella yangjiangensis]